MAKCYLIGIKIALVAPGTFRDPNDIFVSVNVPRDVESDFISVFM